MTRYAVEIVGKVVFTAQIHAESSDDAKEIALTTMESFELGDEDCENFVCRSLFLKMTPFLVKQVVEVDENAEEVKSDG